VHRPQSRRPGAQSPCWLPMRWSGSVVPRSWRTSRTPGRMSSTVPKTALAGMTSDGTSKVRRTRHNRIWSGRFRMCFPAEVPARCVTSAHTIGATARAERIPRGFTTPSQIDWLRDAF
jgi:hypothetical protein